MRSIKIIANITLDGVIQAPGGPDEDNDDNFKHGGWAIPYYDGAMAEAIADAQGKRFDLLLGRRTYDVFAGYWPNAKNDPIGEGLNAATKYVATHRPGSLEWGPAESLGKDVVEGVRSVKAADGPDLIIWGSTTLTAVLFEHGLVDEVLLLVYPVLLGSGKRLFCGRIRPARTCAGQHEGRLVGCADERLSSCRPAAKLSRPPPRRSWGDDQECWRFNRARQGEHNYEPSICCR